MTLEEATLTKKLVRSYPTKLEAAAVKKGVLVEAFDRQSHGTNEGYQPTVLHPGPMNMEY